ncbi:MAG: ABC transporter ATP-binding protein [Thaumarchaeota archaeon]|nr:ABC transporter ATP-binding protein [Nitrososphaerota archaeon]
MEDTLECRNLTKQYGRDPPALENVTLSVKTNGIFALLGRNGAGKTTLIRILATELTPSSGSASINGMDVMGDTKKIRGQIAVMPQEARLVPWLTPRQSIYSYLLYRGFSRKEASSKVVGALAKLGLERYENRLNRRLSGGVKRRVLMTMVLATGAKILFVDEPTTGLDPVIRADLWAMLSELKRDHFIFLTTHYLEEAERLADMIGILENGRLVSLGTLDQLRSAVRYPYSVRVMDGGSAIETKTGEVINNPDGSVQIFTTEDDADRLSEQLVREKKRFSVYPISLEDIFYYHVRKPIEEDTRRDSTKEGGVHED